MLRVGTRGSALALAQTETVVAQLRQRVGGEEFEIVVVSVSGDTASPAGDRSRWVDRIEDALLAQRIDLAVHSAKDVPSELAPGLELAGACAREDPRDALCGATELAHVARVGTASVRRAAQLRVARPGIEVLPLRGNVDTRLARLGQDDGPDAVVLACAGLHRLGRADAIGAALPLDDFVPSPGQGTLALEARADDERARAAAQTVSDPSALAALVAERAAVMVLDAACDTPLGIHAEPIDGGLRCRAFVGLPDGSAWLRDRFDGAGEPAEIGRELGARLLSAGAGALLEEARATA